ncbi:MAG: hypothetical protein MJZ16_01435 [Bacteroidales bacterium]|nr:hypothetical protein [Bacteroidales bacterium]
MKYLNLIPFVILCGYSTLLLIDSWTGFWIFIFTSWLAAACILWSIYALAKAMSNKDPENRRYRRTLIAAQAIVIAMFAVYSTVDKLSNPSSVDAVRKKFDKHETELESFVKSIGHLLYDNTNITLELRNNKVCIFHVTDSLNQRHMNWDEKAVANKDSLMKMSGLDEQEFRQIQNALKSCQCLGIETNLPDFCDVWCSRIGMGLYRYRIYLRPLSEEEQTNYLTKDFHCIPYNDHVLFMFDSSMGKDTFSKEEKEHYLNKFQWESKYYHDSSITSSLQ